MNPIIPLEKLAITSDYPKKLQEIYIQNIIIEDLNMECITISNNRKWQKQVDLRFNKGIYYQTLWEKLILPPKQIEEKTYDKLGKLIKIETYLFNNKGDIIEYRCRFEQENKKSSDKRIALQYNEFENISEFCIYNHQNNLEKRILFEYNSQQLLIKQEIENHSCYIFTYTKANQIEKIEDFKIIGGNKKLQSTTNFQYNTQRNCTYINKFNSIEKEDVIKQQYNYNSQGKITQLESLSGLITNKYDANENLLEENFAQIHNPLVQKRIWLYNKQSKLISYQSVGSFETHFKYNRKGLLIKTERFVNMKKREDTPYKIDKYYYDEMGNIIKIERKSSDFNVTEIFTYDKAYRLISHTKQGDISENLTYAYDDNGGLTRDNYKNAIRERRIMY